MNSREPLKEILSALRALGYTVSSKDIRCVGSGERIAVYLKNEYFGIWDRNRQTFVD